MHVSDLCVASPRRRESIFEILRGAHGCTGAAYPPSVLHTERMARTQDACERPIPFSRKFPEKLQYVTHLTECLGRMSSLSQSNPAGFCTLIS
jgi:hypothetical protein